jgi:hypothetical protein
VKNNSKFETTVFTLAESREFAYNLQEFYKKNIYVMTDTPNRPRHVLNTRIKTERGLL